MLPIVALISLVTIREKYDSKVMTAVTTADIQAAVARGDNIPIVFYRPTKIDNVKEIVLTDRGSLDNATYVVSFQPRDSEWVRSRTFITRRNNVVADVAPSQSAWILTVPRPACWHLLSSDYRYVEIHVKSPQDIKTELKSKDFIFGSHF